MSNLAAMLRLPANLKSTQWQILAGPILILLILSMMVLPLPAFIPPLPAFILDLLFTFNTRPAVYLQYCLVPTMLLFTTCSSGCCVWHLTWLQPVSF